MVKKWKRNTIVGVILSAIIGAIVVFRTRIKHYILSRR